MRFMIMLKGDPGNPYDEQAGESSSPDNELVGAMIRYNEELVEAGVLASAEGLLPSATGARVSYKRGRRTVIDGPFAEAKELVAGYFILDVASKEEAIEWAMKCPVHLAVTDDEQEAVIEIRQIATLDDIEGVSDENRALEQGLREKLVGGS
jgi:hypothetical protein